jgi:hypothetical protein
MVAGKMVAMCLESREENLNQLSVRIRAPFEDKCYTVSNYYQIYYCDLQCNNNYRAHIMTKKEGSTHRVRRRLRSR